jgi:hypothetical protein
MPALTRQLLQRDDVRGALARAVQVVFVLELHADHGAAILPQQALELRDHSATLPSAWRHSGLRQSGALRLASITRSSSTIHAQARLGQRLDVAVFDLEVFLVDHVVQQFGALVVVDAHALLLQHGVVRHEVHLQAGRQRHRAERAMRRQRDVVGFGHGRRS